MKMENIEEKVAAAAARSREFNTRLAEIHQCISRAKKVRKSLRAAMQEVEKELLELLDTSIITLYQSVDNGREIKATFKSGIGAEQVANLNISVPLGPTSIAGYVALSHRPVLIRNVYDQEELTDIHPRLRWEKRFSEDSGLYFRSMVVVPIKDEILLGVVQLINLREDRQFTRSDIKRATLLAQVLAHEFREEFQNTQGPYDYLVQQGRISPEKLEELRRSAEFNGRSVSRLLMEEHRIQADEIGKSLELYYRVPYMKYDSSVRLPTDLIDNISTSYLRNNLWVPIQGDRDEVIILISDPSNYQRIMEIQGILNAKNYVIRVGLPEHILQYLGSSREEKETLSGFDDVFRNLEAETGTVEVDEEDEDESDEEGIAASSAIIQLVNRIIVEADRLGSSDIHIEPGRERQPGVVRVRVDGECRELLSIPGEHTPAVLARVKVISRLDISERRKPQDGKCKLKIRGRVVELRVATVPTVNGESAVLRILTAGGALPVDSLLLSQSNRDKLLNMATHPHGLILVVGPTGSGKTTTLHALLGHINTPNRKIWTAEDPVEITQPGLQQVQVQPKIGFTFAAAMRSFLRADPDVILIGEMRDQETASIGIEASLTGHLVLSTLHTNSAPETVTRLLDLGLDPVNFSDALLGILAQRLMRTLCSDCREAYRPDERELDHLVEQYGRDSFPELGVELDQVELYRAAGCERCGQTGYRGRVGVHEVLTGTNEMQGLIYNHANMEAIREQALLDGMRTLKQDGIAKIFQGLTDYQQLLAITAA